MFQLIPQAVAGRGKVPGTSLYEEAILYLALKQKGVQNFILPIISNPLIISDFIKIFISIIGYLIFRYPAILYFISILFYLVRVGQKYFLIFIYKDKSSVVFITIFWVKVQYCFARGSSLFIQVLSPTMPSSYTGCPKKMFPCLRGYNSCKKGTIVKSKVTFEILRQFSFWWALKF